VLQREWTAAINSTHMRHKSGAGNGEEVRRCTHYGLLSASASVTVHGPRQSLSLAVGLWHLTLRQRSLTSTHSLVSPFAHVHICYVVKPVRCVFRPRGVRAPTHLILCQLPRQLLNLCPGCHDRFINIEG